MICLLGVIAGLCIIFGARGLGEKILRTVAGLLLVVTFLPGLLVRVGGALPSLAPAPRALALVATDTLVLTLAMIGLLAWRLRGVFARRREEARKRSAAPRERALPAPPHAQVPEES